MKLLDMFPLKRGCWSVQRLNTLEQGDSFIVRPVLPRRNGLEQLQQPVGVLLPRERSVVAGITDELLRDRGWNRGVLEESVVDTRIDIGGDNHRPHARSGSVEGERRTYRAEGFLGRAVPVRKSGRGHVIEDPAVLVPDDEKHGGTPHLFVGT